MSNELDEKFVADDGVSSVEEPVTPAGGAIKKKKADVKKSVDPKADKVDVAPGMKEEAEAEEEAIVEEVVEIEESVAALFEGMELSEEFKDKVTLVFEAAVNEAASKKVEVMVAEQVEALETEMQESVDSSIEKIIENLDSYLDYVVEEWMEENTVQIEAGIKVEMAESLMDGLKGLFAEHNIQIDEETVDVVSDLESQVAEAIEVANDAINENVTLAKEIASLKAEKVFEEVCEDLTITQRERMKTLSEKLAFENAEEYASDLQTLKESFFTKKKIVEDVSVEEEEIVVEETAPRKVVSEHYTINALVEALNTRSKKQ